MLFFCIFQCFAEKEYQTEQNLREDLCWNKRNPRDLEWKFGSPQGGHEAGGRAQGGRRASLPRGRLASFLTSTPSPLDHVCSKNNSPKGFITFGFRLIFLFCETLK